MKRILIIEDEPVSADELEKLIRDHDPTIEILTKLDSIEESVRFLRREQPDLIFMDIELADGRSFQIFDEVSVKCPVIFTTAYEEFALEAFEKNGIAYLLKPITGEKLVKAFHKLSQLQYSPVNTDILSGVFKTKNYKENFLFKYGNSLIPVQTSDIMYFYGEDTLVYVVDSEGKQYLSSFNLSQLEEMLDPNDFFRVNRQYITHRQAIQALTPYVKGQVQVTISNKKEIKIVVSRQKTPSLKAWLT